MILPPSFWLTKAYWPAMKSALLICSVDATKEPTLTCAPGANKIPAGLTMNTRPLACNAPMICVTLPSMTRFSKAAWLFGWKILTRSLAPMLNDCQLMIAFCDCWRIAISAFFCAISAAPAATCPPCGNAQPCWLPLIIMAPAATTPAPRRSPCVSRCFCFRRRSAARRRFLVIRMK